MSYNVAETLLDNILATPFAMSVGNMAIVDINAPGVGAGTAPDGTWANPYTSIQAAVDATPTPDLGDFKTLTRVIVIYEGVYDEDVVVTQHNIMVFLTVGQVILSGVPPLGPVPVPDQRSLLYNVDVTPVPYASLTILPLDAPSDILGGARFWVTGDVELAGDAGNPATSERTVHFTHLQAESVVYSDGSGALPKLEGKIAVSMKICRLEGGLTLPSDIVRYHIIWDRVQARIMGVGASGGGGVDTTVQLLRCTITEAVICPDGNWLLCQDTRIGDAGEGGYAASEMWTYGLISNGYFGNGLVIHDNSAPPRGRFTDTNINGQITAPAATLQLDPVTNFYVNAHATIGAGVRILIHDETIT